MLIRFRGASRLPLCSPRAERGGSPQQGGPARAPTNHGEVQRSLPPRHGARPAPLPALPTRPRRPLRRRPATHHQPPPHLPAIPSRRCATTSPRCSTPSAAARSLSASPPPRTRRWSTSSTTSRRRRTSPCRRSSPPASARRPGARLASAPSSSVLRSGNRGGALTRPRRDPFLPPAAAQSDRNMRKALLCLEACMIQKCAASPLRFRPLLPPPAPTITSPPPLASA